MGQKRRQLRAFTLIEILMVVVILGIAAAVVVPQLGTRNDLNAAAGARVVMADLIYAQSQAITTQHTTYVQFSPASNSYALLTSPPNITPLVYMTNPVSTTNYVVTFGSPGTDGLANAALKSASFDGGTVLGFDELGTPLDVSGTGVTTTMTSGTVVISSGTMTKTITIDAYTGALSVQ